jgi:guanylate kinase
MAGSLLIVAAPSGAGKTSLVRHLLQARPKVRLSVSFTTRPPRPGEIDGRDYFFVDKARFEALRDAGQLLEWALVHGNLYGTSRAWIEAQMDEGNDIVLEIDWQGAAQVMSDFSSAVGIYILPPSMAALRERLIGRGQDAAEVIERRLAAAKTELEQAYRFQYVIINQDFNVAADELIAIADVARLRFDRQLAAEPALFRDLGIVAATTHPAHPLTS